MRVLFLWLIVLISSSATGQKRGIEILQSGVNTNLRGMSIPTNDVIWVSGSNGTVGRSTNAGQTWKWITVPGFEQKDFRDIEAFDSSTAIIMAVDNPAYILKTVDAGKTWKTVFERKLQGMFLDAMDFKNNKEGICIGDPLNLATSGRRLFYIIRTYDGGDSWKEVPMYQLPPAQDGEAMFAASGTNISFLNHPDFEYAFISGGFTSNIYFIGREGKPSKMVNVPVVQGKETAGMFSFDTDKQNKYYCIGGDFKVPKDYFDVFYFSMDAGKKWKSPSVGPPVGYRSCIKVIEGTRMIACGPTGVDYASNGHKEWNKLSLESFNVCMVSKNKTVYLAGEKGKIAKAILP